jgi:hypothetical protein
MTNILKARIKLEGVQRVYRCGIVRCPEVLASRPDGGLLAVTPGYAPNREGIFIKTRRAGSRIKHHRQFAEDCVKPLWLEEACNHTAKENAARRYYIDALRSREDVFGFSPDEDDWPLTIRCARCGYLSKIEWTP